MKISSNLAFTFILLLLTTVLFAQDKASISGTIIDASTREALPFATVILKIQGESRNLSGTLTDEQGHFSLSGIETGNYLVISSFVGYQEKQVSVLVGELNKYFDLGKIELQPSTEQLDEVTIAAKKAIVSSAMDKKTFNISDNAAQAGGSVLDAMKALPGITIDQEGKVLLRGSDKVSILIDGKQSSLTGFGNQKGLAGIPSVNIESIEIINNPSAKYDASGMAGIINILYKKETETGFNGDAGFTFGLGALGKKIDDLPTDLGSYSMNPKYIPNLNLNYRTPKVRVFFQSEAMRLRHLPNNEFTTRFYDDGRVTASQVPENRRQSHYINQGGFDWMPNKSNTITISAIYDWEKHIDTAQVAYIDQNHGGAAFTRLWWWQETEITGYMNYRADWAHKFREPGHELTATLQYTKGWEDEQYNLNDSSALRRSVDTTHIIAVEHTKSLLLDYVKPLRSGRLEAGSKVQLRNLPVTYTTGKGENSIIYPGIGDWSDWGENTYAGYLNYIYELSKLELEAGLRAEQTNVFYTVSDDNIYYPENDSYDYFEIYPNIRATYKFNLQNGISAFYNRRVDRPGEPELRVFPKYDDPELLKVGNPYLRPQFTQTFELGYKKNWNTGSAFLSGYYRMIDDPFLRVYSIDDRSGEYDIINKIYHNVGSATNTGVELTFTQSIKDFWKLSGSFNGYNNVINAFEGELLFPYKRNFSFEETKDLTWDIKLNNQFTLARQTQIQLTAIYIAPKNIPQGKQLSRSSVDIGVKKIIMKGKGEITFSFTDIFNDFGLRQEIQGNGFKVIYENYFETQIARLGFKYKIMSL